jgi:hypothetical protein
MMRVLVSGLPLTVLLLIVLMAGCGGNGGQIRDAPSTAIQDASSAAIADALVSVPLVSSTSPGNNATGVAINVAITAAFSKRIDPSTITTATFVVTGAGAVPVAGTVAGQFRTATFTPSSHLSRDTGFTATITTGVKDLEGNALLPSDFVWHFTTGLKRDTTSPTVTSVEPASAATGVDSDTRITATFSEAMDPTTITRPTFALKQGTTPVPGNVSNVTYAGSSTATFTPRDSLASNATFTATITDGVKDLAGKALGSSFVWSFTTGPPPDTTAPTVTSTSPANAATGVSLKTRITATFSEAMAPRAITTAQFGLKQQGSTRVSGTVTYAGLTATFAPLRRLAPCTTYTAWITDGVKDLAGNALASPFVWRFTTGLAPVSLRSAAPFAVLAGSTVTNTALLTTVNGDLGLSPGTAVTGFPPGVVNGAIHAGDPVAAQAKLDLTAAYLDAAGRSCSPVAVAGNLGGQTLYPGLYKSTSSLEISSGDLTLDAQGDPDAVFIFQMASTLITTAGRQVILSGGAKANNVYWQVGSSATLGTTSVFKGNILALASITLQTGATLEGRALTQTAAVTLDGNTVTRPPW